MEKIKVSVIVPVYNAENFLEKSLMSAVKQTLKDIEIICVNDASTDKSLDILTAFKTAFPERFVVINSEKNRGPGGARNIGISYARGEYIGFMDCDDYAEPEMFEHLYSEASEGRYDIVSCGFYSQDCNQYRMPIKIKGIPDDEQRYMYLNKAFYIWNRIFRRELLGKMKIMFRENVVAEDTDFTLEALARAETVSYVFECLYRYNYNEKSETNKKVYNIENEYKKYEQLFESIRNRCMDSGRYNVIERIRKEIIRLYLNSLIVLEIIDEDFSYDNVIRFHNFATKYDKEYYNYKYKNAEDTEKIIYNALCENTEKSFKNLSRLKTGLEYR